jgi:hypothetical protein
MPLLKILRGPAGVENKLLTNNEKFSYPVFAFGTIRPQQLQFPLTNLKKKVK